MTEDEARLILLEQAVENAINTIEFMHGCLTDEKYVYTYPDHTMNTLAELEQLVPGRVYCFHSKLRDNTLNCEACRQTIEKLTKRQEARNVLGLPV